MATKETQITTSPITGIFYLVVAAGMSVLGYYMMVDADSIVLKVLGFVFLLAFPSILYLTVTAGFGGEGPCPRCGSTIQIQFGTESNVLCRSCGRYLDAGKKTLREIDPRRLAEKPTFAAPTPWNDIDVACSKTIPLSTQDYISAEILTRKEGVRVLEARWPEGCCVCGGDATRERDVARTVTYFPPGMIRVREKEVTVVTKGVPHCDEHEDGVAFGNAESGNPPRSSAFCLLFRSYEYRNKFVELNRLKWG